MQFATPTASAYCSSVNAITGAITITSYTTAANFWPNSNSIPSRHAGLPIARAFFMTMSSTTNLPAGLEEQRIYYLRHGGANGIQIYGTLANAVAPSNAIPFTTSASGYLFGVSFLDLCYRHLNSWRPALDPTADIPCCPPVPEVYTQCPDTATITYQNQTVEILRNGPANNQWLQSNQVLDALKFYQGGNLSAHALVTLANPTPWGGGDWYVLFASNFDHPTDEPGQPRPHLTCTFFTLGLDGSGNQALLHLGSASYIGSVSINASKVMDFAYMGDAYLTGNPYGYGILLLLGDVKAAGYLPATIPVTFSGDTAPPAQVKVFMPDAFFAHKSTAINLGHVEETLTYDPATLTYWGEVRTCAGIPGRLHFSIPNYYPLLSTGQQYMVNSSTTFNRVNEPNFWPTRHTIGGDFADGHLNSWSNAEFSLYESGYVEHIQPPSLGYYEILQHKFRLFVASDAYGGYVTGLPQGTTWFDSRVAYNYAPASNYPLDFIQRTNQKKMLIAFSKWGTGRFNKSNGVRAFDSTTLSHFTRNFYAIQSVHPNAHITSLGV